MCQRIVRTGSFGITIVESSEGTKGIHLEIPRHNCTITTSEAQQASSIHLETSQREVVVVCSWPKALSVVRFYLADAMLEEIREAEALLLGIASCPYQGCDPKQKAAAQIGKIADLLALWKNIVRELPELNIAPLPDLPQGDLLAIQHRLQTISAQLREIKQSALLELIR